MKLKILFTLVLGFTSPPLSADEVIKEPAIPAKVAKTALQWMLNSDPQKRSAAYRTFQLYGDEGGQIYRDTLEKAQELHGAKLSEILENERANPFAKLPELSKKLESERTRIYTLIKTDYKKDPQKIKMLRKEVEALVKLNEKARKIAAQKSETLDKSIQVIATALSEVIHEISRIDQDTNEEEAPDRETSLKSIYEGEVYLKSQASLKSIRLEIAALSTAKTENNDAAWAKTPQRNFAHHLNDFRSLFGLTPLILEEKLSDASLGHSKDMAELGFFAHQSPVENKKTPKDRANLAGFQHRWSGENIYMGSTSPIAAYDAWFGSDGHRFIMFAKGPNLLGIGPIGRHWTMMSGRK